MKIKILGRDLKEELETLAKEQNCINVEFVGYAPYPKMAAYTGKIRYSGKLFCEKSAPEHCYENRRYWQPADL